MARLFFSQDLQRSLKETPLFEILSGLDDKHAVFIRPRGFDAEDFIVFRVDGIHFVRPMRSSFGVQNGPRHGAWELEDGSRIRNPYGDIIQDTNRLAGTIRESARQILDASDLETERTAEFQADLKVFPILVFLSPKCPSGNVEKPRFGAFCPTLGGVEWYFQRPMIWQVQKETPSLKIRQMEIERIARLLRFVSREADPKTATQSIPRRIPDRYEFAKAVSGPQFFGRTKELSEFQDLLRSGKHVAVFGLQRVGKTSLVREAFVRAFPDQVERPLFIEVNLHRLGIQPGKFSEFLQDFIEAIVFSTTTTLSELTVSLEDLQKAVSDFLAKKSRPQQMALALQRFLVELGAKVGKKVTIYIDEVQVLGETSKDKESARFFQAFIRALGDTAKDTSIQFLFSGRFSVLTFNESLDWQLLKLCKKIEIDFLDHTSAAALIANPTKGYLSWDATAIELLIANTGGHPYLIQYMCSALVNYANQKNANRIMQADVESITKQLVKSKVDQPTVRLLYSDFESFGLLVHKVLGVLCRGDSTQIPEAELLGLSDSDQATLDKVRNLLGELENAEILTSSTVGGVRHLSLRVGLIREHFLAGRALPLGPEASKNPAEIIERIEKALANIVLTKLKAEFGDGEDGWWGKGIPEKIRARIVVEREKDPERLSFEAYFFTIEYKEIIEKHWTVFKTMFAENPQASKSDNLGWILRLNQLRRTPAHASRAKVRGGLTDEEVEFLLGRMQWIEAQVQHAQGTATTASGS